MKRFITTILIVGGLFLAQQVFALTISPVRFEISGDPGQTLSGEIILFNGQDTTETFYSSFEKFEARGEGGEPHFIPVTEGLATWIKTDAQVTLKPGERKTIPFTIDIPQDAEPGGHFAAIFWGTTLPEITEQGQVVIGAKVGTLVFLSVHGDIPEGEIGILEFNTKDGQKFFNFLPIDFFWRFQNWGGDRIRPTGEITIKNIFGSTRTILIANPYEGNILPGSIRKFTNRWGEEKETGEQEGFFEGVRREKRDFALGKYVAHLNLQWREGTSERKAQAVFSFWIIPWRILLLTFIVLVIVLFLFVVGIKRYNQWIITRAKPPHQKFGSGGKKTILKKKKKLRKRIKKTAKKTVLKKKEKLRRRKRTHGFLVRSRTPGGRRVLMRRKLRNRKKLKESIKKTAKKTVLKKKK